MAPTYLPWVSTNFGAGYISLKRTDGTVVGQAAGTYPSMIPGLINNSNYGIVVGTGSGAEDLEGYQLTTPVIHGTNAGNLSHRAQAATTQAYTAGTKTWKGTLTRLFDNLSGGTIVITETAIKAYLGAQVSYYMMCRDLLGTPVSVLNNGVLTVTYEITLILPG